MKKTVRILVLAMALATILCVFASCGKTLKGEYAAEVAGTGSVLEFKGKNITITYKLLGAEVASVEGTYKIDDDKITIDIESENKEIAKLDGTFDFEEGEDSIKIGLITYKKVD